MSNLIQNGNVNAAPTKPGIKNALDILSSAVASIEQEVGLLTEKTASFRVAVPMPAKADSKPEGSISDTEHLIDGLTNRLRNARESMVAITDGIRV